MLSGENIDRFGDLGTWELNLETGALIWSDRTCSIFGILKAPASLSFSTFLDFVHPDDREELRAQQQESVKNHARFDFIHRIVRPNGETRIVREVAEVLRRPGPIVFHGAVQDISDAIVRLLKCEESERLIDLAGRKARLGGWRYVVGEQSVHWTEATADIHEMPRGTSPSIDEAIAFYTLESQSRIRSVFDRCITVGESFDEILSIVTSNGNHLSVRSIGEAEFDPDGNVVAAFGAFQDVSELIQARAEKSATAALMADRIRQSERLESVGLMTGGIAHDFNNLLTVILGNAESLSLALPENDKLRPLVDMMAMAAERGSELTNRLLAFSRRQPLQSITVEVNDLVTGMVSLLQRAVPGHIEIELALEGGKTITQIDPAQLEVAVLNLVLNAKDAMPEGGKIIIETKRIVIDDQYIGGRAEFQSGTYICLSVTDNGIGMPDDVLQKAFDPFFTTKPVGLGSGLGLSMVYGFVKQSGGHATIYSELGEGTSVKLFLPASNRSITTPAKQLSPKLKGGSEHILVVEDDALVRKHVIATLASLGYKTTAASSGPEALTALQNDTSIELLFTDMVMPGDMNGRALAKKAQELFPSLKVVFTSGYTEEAVVSRSWIDSGVYFLSKPYKQIDLDHLLRRVFETA